MLCEGFLMAWSVILFLFTMIIGVISPVSGVGGGVLFVPLSTVMFPFHVDFIRGAGLVMAVTSAFSSVPYLIKKGLANIKVFVIIAPIMIVTSVIGSVIGLRITSVLPEGKYYIELMLGITILIVFAVMMVSKKLEFPNVGEDDVDSWSKKLKIGGSWFEPNLGRVVDYKIKNLPKALGIFAIIGLLAGMFGLGAGWANVPVLNILMGMPIKIAAATSMLIITANAPAIGIYLSKGAILPYIVVPAILGIMIGARVGAKVAEIIKPVFVKWIVVGVLFVAGLLNVIKGLQGLQVLPHIMGS